MAHRRVKEIDYDEDEYDEYYSGEDEYGYDGPDTGAAAADTQEDELSTEDKEQMRIGTENVRAALGDVSDFVTDEAIQEALWHYYYDVAKSVTYLKNQNAPQQAQPKEKKQKPVSKFDQAATSAAQKPVDIKVPTSPLPRPHTNPADLFNGIPWFNVPEERVGCIVSEQVRPPLRLLGGTGKPSKLAALAAARKKKEAEQKAAQEGAQSEKPAGVASLMDRLGTRSAQPANQENIKPGDATQQPETRTFPIRKRKSPSPPPPVEDRRPAAPEPTTTEVAEPTPKPVEHVRAGPSIFASTMCGGSSRRRPSHQDSAFLSQNILPAIYGHDANLANTNAFSGPSPDDIVMQAQAKASGAKKQASQQKDSKSVTNGVSSLSLEEPQQTSQKVKSKNLDVLAEHAKAGRKNAASFVVIGHVDHGKSTLMGRLLYDLKVVDQRSLDKYRKEATSIGKSSFALAWVMDSTSEERERGVTVDIATNNFETEKTKFTILDAPGHRDFIPNMIAGASQADFAVLVIDAGTNSFEAGLKGQTREHAQLVRSMGVQRIIVAINKMDSINWAQERFEEIQQQISAFLTTTGFQQKNIAFIPCSGLTGENVVTPAPEAAAWYTKTPSHQTLIQALEAHEPTKAALSSPFRLPISDIFRGGVQNPLSISGRIEAGTCQVGDSLIAMPANESCSIKGIEVDNAAADWAVAGQIVTLHLTEIDPVHLRIADLLCDARKPVANIKSFTTKILAFEHVLPMTVDVHRGRMHVPGRISSMVCVLDKSTGNITKKKPRVVQPGSVARVKVELDTAVPLEVPGRIVLRSGGNTVAAGLLEEVHA
ncbi:elongation factor EF-1 alpha subunit, partial [Aureobasidium melanogenum]